MMPAPSTGVTVERVAVSAYAIPTDAPEGDGTIEWSQTVLVVAEVTAAGTTGLGYTYADAATAHFVHDHLAAVVRGRDPLDVPAAWVALCKAVRNLGRPGVASMAISAVDVALWDLKAKLLGRPLVKVLGAARPAA